MARDYRYGAGRKQIFRRQSQQQAESSEGLSSRQLWLVMIVIGLMQVAGYFVVSHFLHAGVRGEKANQPPSSHQSFSRESVEAAAVKSPVTPPEVAPTADVNPEQTSVITALSVPEVEVPEKVDYTFYHGLAKTEVVVDAEPLPVKLPQPYFIQAGSFGSREVAEKEQARLKRFGFETQISGLKGKTRTYYRLRLGPFFDRIEMNKVRNQLRDVGVDTLLIRAPKTHKPQTDSEAATNPPVLPVERQEKEVKEAVIHSQTTTSH